MAYLNDMVDTPRRIVPKIPPVIRFEDVTYRIRFQPLLQHLTFQVEEGETLVLLGRSGSIRASALRWFTLSSSFANATARS